MNLGALKPGRVLVGLFVVIAAMIAAIPIVHLPSAGAANGLDMETIQHGAPLQVTAIYQQEVIGTMIQRAGLRAIEYTNVLGTEDIESALQADSKAGRISMIVNAEWIIDLRASSLFEPAFNLGVLASVYHNTVATPQQDAESLAAMTRQALYAGSAVREFSTQSGLSQEPKDVAAIDASLQLGAEKFKDSAAAYQALRSAYEYGLTVGLQAA